MVIKQHSITICDPLSCTGCGVCSAVCPKSAITMEENAEGFLYPSIHENCIHCGLCVKKCPSNAAVSSHKMIFYMGWHKDRSVLMSSSSGGVFTALSSYVFEHGGVVFGAVKDQNNCIKHTCAASMEELEPLKRSKYYQSAIGDCYSWAKECLQQDKQVLFTGTACQIAGLKQFLGKEYPNLLTLDVLCHGVASKKVIEAFLASKEKQFGKKIVDYHFRTKDDKRGWYRGGGTRMHLFFADGSSVVESGRYDTFFLGFNRNYFLRESCYRCQYCGTERISDFTVADYWNCEHPEITDEQNMTGVSLVLTGSEQAENILHAISDRLTFYQIDPTNAIAHNLAFVRPQSRPDIRDHFFEYISKKGYDSVIHSQFKKRFFKRRIKLVLKRVLPARIYVKHFHD